jgi:hypothetical protein
MFPSAELSRIRCLSLGRLLMDGIDLHNPQAPRPELE